MSDFVYRAKGTYRDTGKRTWVTTGWYRTELEARESAMVFGPRKNVRIHKLNYIAYANKKGHYPRII